MSAQAEHAQDEDAAADVPASEPVGVSAAQLRASAAEAALARFQAQQRQGALPTPEQLAEQKLLAEARDKLVKSLVGEVMDYDKNTPQLAAACVHTLLLIIGNVVADPGDAKKRSVKASSNAFAKKVAAVKGGEAFMLAAGWRKRVEELVGYWRFEHQPGSMQWKVLELAQKELQKAVGEVEEKERRATATLTAAAKKKAGEDQQREILKQQLKADKEERRDRYTYA